MNNVKRKIHSLPGKPNSFLSKDDKLKQKLKDKLKQLEQKLQVCRL